MDRLLDHSKNKTKATRISTYLLKAMPSEVQAILCKHMRRVMVNLCLEEASKIAKERCMSESSKDGGQLENRGCE